jgi:WD40 repeat protein
MAPRGCRRLPSGPAMKLGRRTGFGLALLAITGCATVAPLSVRTSGTEPTVLAPCALPVVPPALEDGRFIPSLSGDLTLVGAEGDERLSAEDPFIVTAWSPDSALVAFNDYGTISVWQSRDGKLVDLIRCVPGKLGTDQFLWSADGRWFVVAGVVREPHDTFITCIADQTTGQVRVLPGETPDLFFDADGRTVRGDGQAIDLQTGSVRPSDRIWGTRNGGAARSHGGGYVARWGVPPYEAPMLEMLDATGRILWRTPRKTWETWQFSSGDRFLHRPEFRPGARSTLFRVQTGEKIEFQGSLRQIAPDGVHVIVLDDSGPELWSLDPVAPVIRPLRRRAALARNRDGSVVAAMDQERFVVERDGRCIPLDRSVSPFDTQAPTLAFTPDGAELYAGLYPSGRPWESRVWSTDTGRALGGLSARVSDVYPMPSVGRVAFGVEGGVRIYDALRGAPWGVISAPRTRYIEPFRGPYGDRADKLGFFVGATADGLHLVGRVGSTVTVWDLAAPHGALDLPIDDSVVAAALSPDERYLAACGEHGVCALWTRDGHPVPLSVRYTSRPTAMAFSPDGASLAVGFVDGLVGVIDTATGKSVGTATLPWQHASSVWWSPDTKRLVVDTTRHFRFELQRG